MSTTPNSLIEALEAADMLEIDDLYAWQFSLDDDLLARPSADSQEQALLSIECIDGRSHRRWQFSLAAVLAARFDTASDSWSLSGADGAHRIKCFAAFCGDNADDA